MAGEHPCATPLWDTPWRPSRWQTEYRTCGICGWVEEREATS